MSDFILHNWEITPREGFALGLDNRAFRFGDGLFETMRVSEGEVLFLADHLARLHRGMRLMAFAESSFFQKEKFGSAVAGLLKKQGYENARMRLSVFRSTGGLYAPTNNNAEFLLETWPLPSAKFDAVPKGIKLVLYEELQKPIHELGSFKNMHTTLYSLAGLHAKEQLYDDAVFLNQRGELCEATSSNVFLLKGKTLVTPNLSSGCVAGIMRNRLIELVRQAQMFELEERVVLPSELDDASEIFLTNAARGIIPVGFYRDYLHSEETFRVLSLLNESI